MRPLLLTALALAAVPVAAQPPSQTARCDSAAQFVSGAALPPSGDSRWMNWYALSRCGVQAARTAAATLQRRDVRRETDDTRLSILFPIFGAFQSKDLFDAYDNAARDDDASESARLLSIDAMTGLIVPASTYLRSALTAPQGPTCVLTGRQLNLSNDINDLPTNVSQRVRGTMQDLAKRQSGAVSVRQLASCWSSLLEQQAPIRTELIHLSYACENFFRVRNSNTASAQLHYKVLKTSETGDLAVDGGEDLRFETVMKGTVRLFFNNQLIDTRDNEGRACR